jgi:glycosyltransferase involved in cell wall biosynthesis
MLAVHRSRGTWTDEITAYIALSEFVRRKFVNSGFTNDRIFIKPNFVYPDPGPGTRRDRGRAAGYALFVGRLSVEKGVDTLLAAWQRIHAEIPLLIIGDGPERMKLEARAASLGVYNVRFSGFLARTEILAAMKGASFLVFPSIWYENFPMTIAEAFACGTPIICSHLGAIAEIVEEGRTGLHFTPGNSKDLEEKAAWALSHPEQMLSMGAEARKEYEEKYTAEKNYRILMSIYERAQAGCSAASLCQSL